MGGQWEALSEDWSQLLTLFSYRGLAPDLSVWSCDTVGLVQVDVPAINYV